MLSKIDSTTGILYGFFANALDDDKKEVKICCLKTILLYGGSNKESNDRDKDRDCIADVKYRVKDVNRSAKDVIVKEFQHFQQFSKISFIYILEMINDEEEEVRFEAIQCLTTLLENFKSLDVSVYDIIYFIISLYDYIVLIFIF